MRTIQPQLNNKINEKKHQKKHDVSSKTNSKTWIVCAIIGFLCMVGGASCALWVFLMPEEELAELKFPKLPTIVEDNKVYSHLTGLELASEADVTAPTYCVQTPNGMDGARPQSGMNEAGVVFEAIAEAGITRFAAIYQNPSAAVIGPIRSLRLYYLQWDTPFDCTIVHAGGADDALAAVRVGGYKDLTENYTYMYRGGYSSRLWNNLFITSANLAQMNTDRSYGGSDVHGFKRMKPADALKARVDDTVAEKLVITKPSTVNLSEMKPMVQDINIHFGGLPNFNVVYNYNAETNTYNRSYESGAAHEIYSCPAENLGGVNPEDNCNLVQLSPSVVVAMIVEEHKASDNYHEDITAIGSGTAYIFQNGVVTVGTWTKSTVEDQIKFHDEKGTEVALIPGQTFVEAVPDYGWVEY